MPLKPIDLQIESRFLRGGIRALLFLPSDNSPPRRLLTLLHGAEETPETLLVNYDISAAAESSGMAILLPSLGNSFYLDWGPGQNARSALRLELIPAAQERCCLSDERKENVVGGISMGGFGAMSLALCEPDRFSAAFSLSGALDLKKAAQLFRICQLSPPGDFRLASGKREAQLNALLAENAAKPALYLAWGDQDWFRKANLDFSSRAAECGFAVTAAETAGVHDWDYWKQSLPAALDWVSET